MALVFSRMFAFGRERDLFFTVRRKTIRKRMGAKLREVKQQLRERMHDPVRQTRLCGFDPRISD